MSSFWIALLEAIYLPIYNILGYDSILTFAFLIIFVGVQYWIFWHLIMKPVIYIVSWMLNFVKKNYLFTNEVEFDEKKNR